MQTSVFICQKIKQLPFIVYVQYYDDREIERIIISNESEFGLFFPILFHAIIINYTIDFFWKKRIEFFNENERRKWWKMMRESVSLFYLNLQSVRFFPNIFYCFILFLTLILLIRRHHINLLFHTSRPEQIDIEWNRTCKPDYRMRERRKNEQILKLALSKGRCRHEIVHICTRYRKSCYIER